MANEPIGTQEGVRLAEQLLKMGEEHFFPPVALDVRTHVIAQLGGVFKSFYERPDHTYGHTNIEKTLRENAFDKMAKETRHA